MGASSPLPTPLSFVETALWAWQQSGFLPHSLHVPPSSGREKTAIPLFSGLPDRPPVMYLPDFVTDEPVNPESIKYVPSNHGHPETVYLSASSALPSSWRCVFLLDYNNELEVKELFIKVLEQLHATNRSWRFASWADSSDGRLATTSQFATRTRRGYQRHRLRSSRPIRLLRAMCRCLCHPG
jgi:hypothetical protein